MSLNKGLSAALLLFKRPAGCLSASLFKGHSERAGGREDEGARKDDDYDDDDDLSSTMTMTMTMTL
jgi:hypothetical protein